MLESFGTEQVVFAFEAPEGDRFVQMTKAGSNASPGSRLIEAPQIGTGQCRQKAGTRPGGAPRPAGCGVRLATVALAFPTLF